jgi:RNA polymerase sigma-70 factor (ECF subfamily)
MGVFPLTRPSLLIRLRDQSNAAAWEEFVDIYTPLVYGYARKQGLQSADAADLAQDVFAAVAASVSRLDYDQSRGTFRAWLFTIVRRKLSKRRSAPCNRIRGGGDTATQVLLELCPAPEDLEAEWEAEWQHRLFVWACAQVRGHVTHATWQAFWRTAVDGAECREVAAELGLSLTAVYVARSRILAQLKELIQSVQDS